MLTENVCLMRQMFLPIAILEHHQMIDPKLNIYEICERLGRLWPEIRREAQACTFTLDAHCIQGIKRESRNRSAWMPGYFEEGGQVFLDEITEDGPEYNWAFSALYWDHLSKFGLSRRGFSRTQLGYSVSSRNTA